MLYISTLYQVLFSEKWANTGNIRVLSQLRTSVNKNELISYVIFLPVLTLDPSYVNYSMISNLCTARKKRFMVCFTTSHLTPRILPRQTTTFAVPYKTFWMENIFNSEEQVSDEALEKCFQSIPTKIFKEGIHKLSGRWEKAILYQINKNLINL